jgi:hypothetical protein
MEFMKNKIEKYAQNLRIETETLIASRCGKSCECTYDSCDTAVDMYCQKKLQTTFCTNCGMLVNLERSNVFLANRFSNLTTDDPRIREMICATTGLDTMLVEIYQNEDMFNLMYFGTYSGVYRRYPLRYAAGTYDPRYRPWYVSAASGNKNVIFLIDSSAQTTDDQFKTITQIFSFLLSTFSFNDYVGLVNIGNDELVFSPYLLRANYVGTGYITNFFKKLSPRGEANLENSINKLYDIIDRSFDSDRTSGCNTFIIYISAGSPTQGIKSNNDLYDLIINRESVIDKNKPFYFTYTLGESEYNSNFPYYLACNKDGIYENVDVNNFYPSFLSYFQTIGLTSTESSLVYAEPYSSASDGGFITTASISVFDRSRDIPFRVGVIGLDMSIDDLLTIGRIDEVYLAFSEINKSACQLLSLTQCQIESIRPDKYKCKNMNLLDKKVFTGCAPIPDSMDLCAEKVSEDVFCKGDINPNADSQILNCCSVNSCFNYTLPLVKLLIITTLILTLLTVIIRRFFMDKWNKMCCKRFRIEKKLKVPRIEYIFDEVRKINK